LKDCFAYQKREKRKEKREPKGFERVERLEAVFLKMFCWNFVDI
jgi:hypothetical protein